MKDRLEPVFLMLVLAATAAIYARVAQFDFVSFDDDVYVYQHKLVTDGFSLAGLLGAFSTPYLGNWHPLTLWSHMLDVSLFGLRAGGHHLTSLFLHLINAFLVFTWCRRITARLGISLLVTLLFALHPLNVEPVVWVAQRKSLLSFTFGFSALIFYDEWIKTKRASFFSVAVVTFLMSLMSKATFITLPVLILLLDIWPYGRSRLWHSDRSSSRSGSTLKTLSFEKIPFFLLSTLIGLLTISLQHSAHAMEALQDLTLGQRVGHAGISLWLYLGKALYPTDLCAHYKHPSGWPVWVYLFSSGALILTAKVVWKVRKSHPWLLVGSLWFVISFIPMIGIVQVGSQSLADRYFYLPSIGLFLSLAVSLAHIADKGAKEFLGALGISIGVIVLFLGGLSWFQIENWRDSTAMYQQALRVDKENPLMHSNFGNVLRGKKLYAESLEHFKAALTLEPNYPEAKNNLGVTLMDMNRLAEAKTYFEEALRLSPSYSTAHSNLGYVLLRQGDKETAQNHFEEALTLNSRSDTAAIGLATVLQLKGNCKAAIDLYRQILVRQPNHATVQHNIKACERAVVELRD